MVTNAGNVTLTNVTVTDPGTTVMGGPLATLAVGAADTTTFTATYLVTQADINSGSFTNIATTTGYDPNGDPTRDDDDETVTADQNPMIVLEKTVSRDGSVPGQQSVQATNGATVTYSFVVLNAGNVTLTNVLLVDTDIVPIMSSNLYTLAVGQAVTVSVTRLVNGDLTNTASVVGYDPNNDPVSDTDDAVVDQITPLIAVDKTVSLDGSVPGFQTVHGTNGAALTYSFVVSNPGDVALTNVTLVDGLLTFSTNLGTLVSGESVTVTVISAINGDLTNIAIVTGYDPNNDPIADSDDAVVDQVLPAFELVKTRIFPGLVASQVGEPVVFTVTVRNTGDVDLVTVPLEDTYETAYLSFTSAVPTPVDATNDGVLNWANLGPLAPGASTSVVVNFIAVRSSAGTNQTNLVVSAPTTPVNYPSVTVQTSTAPYRVSKVGFTLTKTLIDPTNRPVVVNEPMTFAIRIANTGDIPLVTVPVRDLYETGIMTYSNATPASDDNQNDGEINWANVGPLNPGVTTTLLVRFTMIANTLGTLHTNTVIVAPTTAPDQPTVPPQTNRATFSSQLGWIGDTVWVDDNLNGLPDEDLATKGLNNVRVRLYQIVNGTTNYIGETWTATIGGRRGTYLFSNLTYGTYLVVVDRSTIPTGLDISTTPPTVTVELTPKGFNISADFGFVKSTPTAVQLMWFRGARENDQVKLSWETAIELNNLGYNVYRSASETGERQKLNLELIAGAGTGAGRVYEWWDEQPASEAVVYYWLEDVETTGKTEWHGPVVVRRTDLRTEITLPGATLTGTLFKVTGATLDALGLPVTSTDADRLQVWVNDEPISVFSTAEGRPMADDDWVLFSVEGLTVTNLTIDLSGEPGLRMEMLYARPSRSAGDVGSVRVGVAQVARVAVAPDKVRYLLSGFTGDSAWLLDVTEARNPRLMLGAQWVRLTNESGLYFSHPEAGPAQCIGVGSTAVIEWVPTAGE
jgi:uncharacterized repeat protein (TIGR01451 family)